VTQVFAPAFCGWGFFEAQFFSATPRPSHIFGPTLGGELFHFELFLSLVFFLILIHHRLRSIAVLCVIFKAITTDLNYHSSEIEGFRYLIQSKTQ
jgi:hypothetical protein